MEEAWGFLLLFWTSRETWRRNFQRSKMYLLVRFKKNTLVFSVYNFGNKPGPLLHQFSSTLAQIYIFHLACSKVCKTKMLGISLSEANTYGDNFSWVWRKPRQSCLVCDTDEERQTKPGPSRSDGLWRYSQYRQNRNHSITFDNAEPKDSHPISSGESPYTKL